MGFSFFPTSWSGIELRLAPVFDSPDASLFAASESCLPVLPATASPRSPGRGHVYGAPALGPLSPAPPCWSSPLLGIQCPSPLRVALVAPVPLKVPSWSLGPDS